LVAPGGRTLNVATKRFTQAPMRVQQPDTGREFDLEAPPLGSGGEAAVFAVSGQSSLVAKIYHKPTSEYAEKLAVMLAAPPDDPMARTGHASIAWPTGLLVSVGENARFVGFLMPRIDQALGIHEYYIPKVRQTRCPLFHYGYLMRTARNLAAAVRAVHDRGYVVGDLSGPNVLVTRQALVTLIDTDSFQVRGSGKVYRCRVSTPEYTAAELHNTRLTEVDRDPEHDTFGLGVLIFQLLMQGTHPFAGVFTGAGEPGSIPRRILQGHWPYATGNSVPYQPNPNAPPWDVVPPVLQRLFVRCFQEGHAQPERRPTALDWQQALQAAEKELTLCANNGQHHYYRGLNACPWCTLAGQHGRDPFPTPDAVKESGHTSGSLPVLSGPGVASATLPERGGPVKTIPVAIPVALLVAPPPAPAGPDLLKHVTRILLAAAATVVFLFVAALVAWGSWKLTHRERPQLVHAEGSEKDRTPVPHDDPADGPAEAKTPDEVPPPAVMPAVGKEAKAVLVGRGGRIESVGVSADGRSIIAFSPRDSAVQYWTLRAGQIVRRDIANGRIGQICLSHSAEQMLVLRTDSQLSLWNTTPPQARFYLNTPTRSKKGGEPQLINSAGLSPDGKRVIALNFEKIVMWEARSGKMIRQYPRNLVLKLDVNRAPVLSESGQVALFHCTNGAAVLDTTLGRVESRFENDKPFQALGLSLDGKLVVAAADNEITVRSALTGKVLRTLALPRPVTSAIFNRSGAFVLLGDDDGNVRLWNVRAGKEVLLGTGHEAEVSALAFSADGRLAVSGDAAGTVRVWDMPAQVWEEVD
jgi:hypothetical protein